MSKSRREFLLTSAAMAGSAAVAGTTAIGSVDTVDDATDHPSKVKARGPSAAPSGTPPAFGTAPPVGPEIDASVFAAAEKLMQVEMTAAERELAAANWRTSMAAL